MVTVVRRVVGALLCLTGVVWIGQGTNLIQGSSMTGSTFWAVMGAVCVAAGLFLLGWPWRQSRATAQELQLAGGLGVAQSAEGPDREEEAERGGGGEGGEDLGRGSGDESASRLDHPRHRVDGRDPVDPTL